MSNAPSINGTDESSRGVYYLTQDTRAISTVLTGNQTLSTEQRKEIQECADHLWISLVGTIRRMQQTVLTFSEESIQSALQSAVEKELRGTDSAVLCLDKYLLRNEDTLPFPVLRGLDISRMADGTKAPRQGGEPIERQLDRLQTAIGKRPIILVDDGVFSGGSIRYVLDLLRTRGLSVEKIIVYMGNPTMRQIGGIDVSCALPLERCIDWVDARDLTILGGRPQRLSRNCRVATSRPYIAPFSDGSHASLNARGLNTVSLDILRAQEIFFAEINRIIGTRLTLRDALRVGFPLPMCEEFSLEPLGLSTTLQNVCAQARTIVDQQSNATGDIVIDMDGTLYTLDGPGNRFAGSTLAKNIGDNIRTFIQGRENCSRERAEEILEQASADTVGPSVFLSRRYGIERTEYFQNVWGVLDPDVIVRGNETKSILRELKQSGRSLRLLTSAPAVWTKKVMQSLDIEDLFDDVTTAELFNRKHEVFRRYASRKEPAQQVSVGDQLHSDILPAREAGMQTIQVSAGRPLSYLRILL